MHDNTPQLKLGESFDDEDGKCKMCGHNFNEHLLIASNKNNLEEGGIMQCPVVGCKCQTTWDFNSKK